jgi:hypothetical protein
MVEDLFGALEIGTSEADLAGISDDLFLIVNDGRVVASSPLETLKETLLMVNSDLYTTGGRSIEEITVPDVILELSDTVFTVEGYPTSDTEKLVLTLVARYIEQRALLTGTGTLRTSLQRLSRLDDEQGTREVYERLGGVGELETHVYGLPDWEPPGALDLRVHGVADDEILRHWFVIYCSEVADDVAMLATKTGAGTWQGYWTFDAAAVRAIDGYIRQTF